MLPLHIPRLYDHRAPIPDQAPRLARVAHGRAVQENASAEAWELERRAERARRTRDGRRAKQQSIFLNTRKAHGRRFTSGRRFDDQSDRVDHRPLSIKG